MKSLRSLLIALATLAAGGALAQDQKPQPQTQTQDELIERVVVRNRLYNMRGKLELTPTVGFTLVTRLTDHTNFNLGVAYNIADTLAFEARGGYALSRHTGLANQVSEHVMQRDPFPTRNDLVNVSDMSGLWEMKANAVVGVRWAPLYGKISLMAELPVHFQAYLWAGGGAGMFERESIVYCQARPGSPAERAEGTCGPDNDQWLTDEKTTWLASAAAGLRFFTHQGGGIRVEIRNYLFQDSYLVDINRTLAETGQITGEESASPGLTNLVLFDLGYSFIF